MDCSVVVFHGSEHIQKYLLTLMNIVSLPNPIRKDWSLRWWLIVLSWPSMPIIICNAQIVFLLHTLKKKVIYWLLWFHEEHLTFMEALHCTKGSGKGYLGYYNVLHTTVKVQFFFFFFGVRNILIVWIIISILKNLMSNGKITCILKVFHGTMQVKNPSLKHFLGKLHSCNTPPPHTHTHTLVSFIFKSVEKVSIYNKLLCIK